MPSKMTSPTQSCELATEVVAAIGSLRQLVLSIQPLLDELCAQRAVHSYNRRFLEECDQVLTQLLAEHKTHTEELRLINQDINHLEDLLKNVRNSQETQKVDLTRKVSEFRFEVRGANQLIKSSEIENVDEENENLILDENELLKVPESLSESTDQPTATSLPNSSVPWSQLFVRQNLPLFRFNSNAPNRPVANRQIGQETANKLKNCQSCLRSIHRNAPTCPYCKVRSRSKNPRRSKKRPDNCTSKMSSNYKYTYLNVRGFGEVPRLMFHHANVDFEDVRYTRDEFQNVKENFPNKQVPLLEVNGHPISQSGAIVRFLAYRFALGGKDEFERARADEIYGVFFDRMREHRDYHLFRLANPGQDNEELFYSSFVPSAQKALPFYEQVVEEANEHGGFVLSSGLSYADFVVAEHVTTLFKLGPQFKDDHPNLIAFAKKIYAVSPGVERYVAQRPDTVV
ncbi:CRE-GST-13 protein [Aphelenchoides besseyi]|nr:CRE-GST-13 protein [Aphelenchoides besseyi]